jgi:hypothetical protein
MRLLPVFPLAVAVCIYSAACGTTDPLSVCPDSVTVAVSSGLSPAFDWSPRCGIHIISVMQETVDDSARVRWAINVTPPALMTAPMPFGQVPAGANVETAAKPLESGKDYGVRIYRIDPSRVTLVGIKFFRP